MRFVICAWLALGSAFATAATLTVTCGTTKYEKRRIESVTLGSPDAQVPVGLMFKVEQANGPIILTLASSAEALSLINALALEKSELYLVTGRVHDGGVCESPQLAMLKVRY